ncbi:MAG: hypothetical protein ACK40O_04990 [Allosphingosinicella sp.]
MSASRKEARHPGEGRDLGPKEAPRLSLYEIPACAGMTEILS